MASPPRVALVTGGAKRVGRAIVERLGAAGFDIAFTYHRSDPNEVSESLSKLGCQCLAIHADLTAPQVATQKIFDTFATRFDHLDVLVNNASLFESGRLTDGTSEQHLDSLRRMNAVHVESPLLLCQHFEPMLRRTPGHVINMIDLLAERPTKPFLAYSTSKAALANLTTSLAAAFAPEVTVNGISPGVVDWADNYPPEKRQQYLTRVPLNRAGTPQDVADLVHYLATAAPFITGQIIRLDGGRSIT